MKKIIFCLLLISCLFGTSPTLNAANSPFSLVTSILTPGDLAGGLRYAVNENWVIEGWVTQKESDDGQTHYGYWADVFYKSFGVIVYGESDLVMRTSLAYSLEYSLTEKISIGNTVKLIELSDRDPSYLGGWDVYIALNI